MGEIRFYRDQIRNDRLVSFNVIVQETDLLVMAQRALVDITKDLVIRYRGHIESYIQQHPEFTHSLVPWDLTDPAPEIIRQMVIAGQKAGVGPMAAVAGAIAESVGRELLAYSDEIIVENGGDIFIKTNQIETFVVFAGKSSLSMRLGLRIDSQAYPVAVCTSSGTIGHSYSGGEADAVCVLANECALADAAATAIGNQVRTANDINDAIGFGKRIENVRGIMVIIGGHIGIWGGIEVVPVAIKNS
jgi:ApbE superfamily uncharacterized protein (UPF0280 family)